MARFGVHAARTGLRMRMSRSACAIVSIGTGRRCAVVVDFNDLVHDEAGRVSDHTEPSKSTSTGCSTSTTTPSTSTVSTHAGRNSTASTSFCMCTPCVWFYLGLGILSGNVACFGATSYLLTPPCSQYVTGSTLLTYPPHQHTRVTDVTVAHGRPASRGRFSLRSRLPSISPQSSRQT